jgi:hypothetical protein
MADWQRDRLYEEIRSRLAERPDGMLRRHWVRCCMSRAGAVSAVERRLAPTRMRR